MHKTDVLEIIPANILDMRNKQTSTFTFNVKRNGIKSHLIVSNHQHKLKGFDIKISTQTEHYNHKIQNDTFDITLTRNGDNNDTELEVILGVCTYPANKTVKAFKVLI